MNRLVLVAILAGCVTAWSAMAGEGKKDMTPEQKKQVHAELLAKYDTNKDGKLERSEKAKMTKEDKKRWDEAGGKQSEKHHESKPDED